MTTELDLSAAPYHSDWARDSRYLRYLFKPGQAVQVRELNGLQEMLQGQIESMGAAVFRRGTIIDGCNFVFHDDYPYVKIEDLEVSGNVADPAAYVGMFVRGANGLIAHVVDSRDGYESTDPDLKTLYVRYVNAGDSFDEEAFQAGQILTVRDANDSVHWVTVDSRGSGYSNSDWVAVVPAMVVNVTAGSVANGDTVSDPVTNAHAVVVRTADLQTRAPIANLVGTVAVTTNDPTVTGTGTAFDSDFVNGAYVAVYSNATAYTMHRINVVVNATSMELSANAGVTGSAQTYANASHSLVVLTVKPRTADLANASANASAWSFSVGNTVSGQTAADAAEVVEILGSGACTVLETDSSGRIQSIVVSSGGSGYTNVPYAALKTSTGTSGNVTALTYLAQVTVANVSAPVGSGYAFGVTDGSIFQKGFFVPVERQTVVVEPYSRTPNNVAVYFRTEEELVDVFDDESLYDNVTGEYDSTAPGADRLKLTAVLAVNAPSLVSSNAEVYPLVEWSNGVPYKQRNYTQFSSIDDELARRTRDSDGDYVVDEFLVATTSPANSSIEGNTYTVVVDPGTAYVDGRRIQTVGNFVVDVPKATETRIVSGSRVSLNYGAYVRLRELGGFWEHDQAANVQLYDTAKTYLSLKPESANTDAVGTQIGTARLRSLVWEQGTPGTPDAVYRAYLFDVRMSSGRNFRAVRSVRFTDGTSVGIADASTEYDQSTAANVAVFYNQNDGLVFDGGFPSPLNANAIVYQYRTVQAANLLSNSGVVSVPLVAVEDSWPYTGTLSTAQRSELYVAPLSNVHAFANGAGTVATTTGQNANGSANLIGTGTAFLTAYRAGDWIALTGNTTENAYKRVLHVVNNTFMYVSSNVAFTNAGAAHYRGWPRNVPIDLSLGSGYSANANSTVLSIDLGSSLNVSGNTRVAVGYNVQRTLTGGEAKTVNRDLFVKLRLANNDANTVGPWCLGIPDAFRLKAVYVHTASSVNVDSTDVTSEFLLDINQTTNYYDLAYLYRAPASGLVLNQDHWLLVKLDALTASPGVYNATSYVSANAALRANNDSKALSALGTDMNSFEVPELNGGTGYFDLLSAIDFRPYAANTANLSTTVAGASVNPVATLSFAATDRMFPVPDSILSQTVEHFLDRVDIVTLSPDSTIDVVRGRPGTSARPKAPAGAMVLNAIRVPGYPANPSIVSNNVSQILARRTKNETFTSARALSRIVSPTFTRRDVEVNQPGAFTKSDAGKLRRRVADIEYYVSLSLIESQMRAKVIPSRVDPSIDRYKYGFFADDFNTAASSELASPEWRADLENGKLVPHKEVVVVPHSNANGVPAAYTEYNFLSQLNATNAASTTGANTTPTTVKYVGTLVPTPEYFTAVSNYVNTKQVAVASQRFRITVTGLRPLTVHNFFFKDRQLNAQCLPIRTGAQLSYANTTVAASASMGGSLVSDVNGRLVLDYFFDTRSVGTAPVQNQTYGPLSVLPLGDQLVRVASADASSTAQGYLKTRFAQAQQTDPGLLLEPDLPRGTDGSVGMVGASGLPPSMGGYAVSGLEPGGGGAGGGKVVCTAMNSAYGFGSFRNAIWLRYSAEHLTPYHERGYHAIFVPLVRYAYGPRRAGSSVLRRSLEWIARHRTADIWSVQRGRRRDVRGRLVRAVLEPVCYIAGRIASAAGK